MADVKPKGNILNEFANEGISDYDWDYSKYAKTPLGRGYGSREQRERFERKYGFEERPYDNIGALAKTYGKKKLSYGDWKALNEHRRPFVSPTVFGQLARIAGFKKGCTPDMKRMLMSYTNMEAAEILAWMQRIYQYHPTNSLGSNKHHFTAMEDLIEQRNASDLPAYAAQFDAGSGVMFPSYNQDKIHAGLQNTYVDETGEAAKKRFFHIGKDGQAREIFRKPGVSGKDGQKHRSADTMRMLKALYDESSVGLTQDGRIKIYTNNQEVIQKSIDWIKGIGLAIYDQGVTKVIDKYLKNGGEVILGGSSKYRGGLSARFGGIRRKYANKSQVINDHNIRMQNLTNKKGKYTDQLGLLTGKARSKARYGLVQSEDKKRRLQALLSRQDPRYGVVQQMMEQESSEEV